MPRERREQLLLDVAGRVFATSGYESASMDEIAELGDVSKPMLYAYFGSKEGLYLAYIRRAGGELVDRLTNATAHAGDRPSGRLRARIVEFLSFVEEHRDGWRVLFREVGSSQPLAENVAETRERIAQTIRLMIEASGPGLEHREPASDAIAHAVVGAGESLANWWLDHPEVGRDEVADWYLGVVQAVLSGPSGPAHRKAP
jgi:AcrR family transcriptional regulator